MRRIFAALVACALFLAPLAAQAKMAAHAAPHQHRHAAAQQVVTTAVHDDHHGDHRHDDHSHTTTDVHQSHHPVGDNGHRDHHDGACCGTYCHSGCIVTSLIDFRIEVPAQTFAAFVEIGAPAVSPDQPQRPPSDLQST
jgi:hypothetical protein